MKKEKNNNENNKYLNPLLKIVYYDEDSAIDYVTLKYGGNYDFNELKKAIREIKGSGNASAGFKISSPDKSSSISKISPLAKILKFSTNINSSIKAEAENNNILTTTLKTNTMVEFIKLCVENENEVKRFDGFMLDLDDKFATYLKVYLPYMKFIKPEVLKNGIEGLEQFDITKLDEVLEVTNGYYSFKAVEDKKTKFIFRFNINGLKNNYKLQDLIGMNLVYYGIKVGTSTLNEMDLENQLNKGTKKNKTPYFENDEKLQSEENRDEKLDIYDIIIAGVSNEN